MVLAGQLANGPADQDGDRRRHTQLRLRANVGPTREIDPVALGRQTPAPGLLVDDALAHRRLVPIGGHALVLHFVAAHG